MSVSNYIKEREKMFAEMERDELITESIMITSLIIVILLYFALVVYEGFLVETVCGIFFFGLLFCLVYKTLKSRQEK